MSSILILFILGIATVSQCCQSYFNKTNSANDRQGNQNVYVHKHQFQIKHNCWNQAVADPVTVGIVTQSLRVTTAYRKE